MWSCTRSGAQQASLSSRMPPNSNIHHDNEVLAAWYAAEELRHCILVLLHVIKKKEQKTQTSFKFAYVVAFVTSMVCLNSHSCIAIDCQSQEYRCGAIQGAALDKQAIRIGCHRTRTYTMTTRCSVNGMLQRICNTASQTAKVTIQEHANALARSARKITV